MIMSGKIIDGKAISAEIRKEVASGVSAFRKKHGMQPALAVVMVGDYEPSKVYVRMKERACEEAGIRFVRKEFSEIGTDELIRVIRELNQDKAIHGILVQLPLLKGMDEERVLAEVGHEKDVDGFHLLNAGKLFKGEESLVPCTPLGVMVMLERSGIALEGKDVVIVNRSNVVGKPLSMLMLGRNATVTLCHSRTRDLAEHTRRADVLVAAVGVAEMIGADMVKKGAVVIDVGITRKEGKLFGDVDFERVKDKASAITPVPGGVGPMTVAMVISNTLKAARSQTEGEE